jgi:hypothetical protein
MLFGVVGNMVLADADDQPAENVVVDRGEELRGEQSEEAGREERPAGSAGWIDRVEVISIKIGSPLPNSRVGALPVAELVRVRTPEFSRIRLHAGRSYPLSACRESML